MNRNKENKQTGILAQISQALAAGNRQEMLRLCRTALEQGMSAREILEQALFPGMEQVGEKFHSAAGSVPEIMLSSRAMNEAVDLLRPHILADRQDVRGRVCIGTVQGDLHDIGKNIVAMVLESEGFEVIDLGVDVSPTQYVETALRENCDIICCSALLTTTMPVMGEVVQEVRKAGAESRIKVMIGGAPVSGEFASAIKADGYSVNAADAGRVAVRLIAEKRKQIC